jgi:hypothetical protein
MQDDAPGEGLSAENQTTSYLTCSVLPTTSRIDKGQIRGA